MAAQVQITTTTDKQNIHRTHPNVPTFEVWLSSQLHLYQRLLEDARCDDADEQMRAAFAHVSTLNLGAHAFDAIKGFFQRRGHFPQVKLFIAEDNEAVDAIVAPGEKRLRLTQVLVLRST